MGKLQRGNQDVQEIADFEEGATREVRGVLEAAGRDDAAQYRVQVLCNGEEPLAPQQSAMARRAAEKAAAGMGLPLCPLGGRS